MISRLGLVLSLFPARIAPLPPATAVAGKNVTTAQRHPSRLNSWLILVGDMSEDNGGLPQWPSRNPQVFTAAPSGHNPGLPMSSRTPDQPSINNLADEIEKGMVEDGHRIWGWVVYRCTYENDEQWNEWKKRFLARSHASLQSQNGLDLWDSFSVVFLEDREKFNNASAAVIREHFQSWTTENAIREQDGVVAGRSVRYRYCVQVDHTSLQSTNDVPGTGQGSVVIIEKDWEPDSDEEADDDILEPIDGCFQEDVGWGRFKFIGFATWWYSGLRSTAGWEVLSRRPPKVAM